MVALATHIKTQTHTYTPYIGMVTEIGKSTMRALMYQNKARNITYQLLLEAKPALEKYFIVC